MLVKVRPPPPIVAAAIAASVAVAINRDRALLRTRIRTVPVPVPVPVTVIVIVTVAVHGAISVKVLVNSDDDKVVGIHIVSKDAGEIMQGFGSAMLLGVTKQNLFDTVAIHPTIAEELVCIPGIDMMPASRKYRDHKLVTE